MYTVEFYETADGVSELWDFLEELRLKSKKSKDARIQLKQIFLYIQLLQENGTRISDNITKHLEDGIWELRPGNNRRYDRTVRHYSDGGYRARQFLRIHNHKRFP